MKNRSILFVAFAALLCLTLTAVAATTAPLKVNNTICPVMGKPVDTKNPVTVEYNGKIYNVCCSMCPAVFKSDPERYSKIAEEQAKAKK